MNSQCIRGTNYPPSLGLLNEDPNWLTWGGLLFDSHPHCIGKGGLWAPWSAADGFWCSDWRFFGAAFTKQLIGGAHKEGIPTAEPAGEKRRLLFQFKKTLIIF